MTEFVIISGPEVHDYLVVIRAQLRAYLTAAFPQFRFSLVSQQCEGMGFVVVPVAYDEGDDAGSPSETALGRIRLALEAFQPTVN